MKKIISFFLAITMALSLAACSATENQENQSSEALESSSAVLEQETIDSSSSEMKASGSEPSEIDEEQESKFIAPEHSRANMVATMTRLAKDASGSLHTK